jgi:K+-sensing histidine kinase KdpD
MSADQIGAALRRGRRLDEKVPGWGLGLSIVSDLVDINGGEMSFGKSNLGGQSVVVTIPRP